jgi:hypothetical protein
MVIFRTLPLPVARELVFHGSYSYPCLRLCVERSSNLINAISVEEEPEPRAGPRILPPTRLPNQPSGTSTASTPGTVIEAYENNCRF